MAKAQAIKPKEESEIVEELGKKMGLPRPTSKAQLNKIFRQEAKKVQGGEKGLGGDVNKMSELSRWQSYWKNKVAAYHPYFQDGFAEELSKIASL